MDTLVRTLTRVLPSQYVRLDETVDSPDCEISSRLDERDGGIGTSVDATTPSLIVVGGLVLLLIPNQRANVDRIPTGCCASEFKGANSVNFVGDSKLLAMIV